MNVETITMPRSEAADLAAVIRRQLLRRHSAELKEEWAMSLAAYDALAKGTKLINPKSAIEKAGLGVDGFPNLAICRADYRRVQWRCNQWDRHEKTNRISGYFQWGQQRYDSAAPNRFNVGWLERHPENWARISNRTAIVPMIPANVYPKRGNGSPSDWFILWEADWKAAPVDPILLKPIPNTTLYAVLATWDLTPVERAVIEQTRREAQHE